MTKPIRTGLFPSPFPNPPAALALACLLFCLAGQSRAADDDFRWRQYSGESLRVMLVDHPYSQGIIKKLRDFERLSGINVVYIVYPEDMYFAKLNQAFETGVAKPDVYMIGPYLVWEFAPRNWMEPLDRFVADTARTRSSYDIDDFFPGIIGSFRWDKRAGSQLGAGPLWAMPIGFEASAVTYNREVLARHRLSPPSSLEELLETGKALNHFDGPDTNGVALRGLGEWNSIHAGYITAFANYGARDMAIENGRLVSKVDSPEAVAVTDLWVRILRECCSDDWERYNWYKCLSDLGNRRAAMVLDADILGYFANAPGASPQSGKLGMVPPPAPPGTDRAGVKSNLWVWGFAINPEAASTGAAWFLVQYFTSREFQEFSVLEWRSVNPPRKSVFENPAFQAVISSMPGFAETFSSIIPNTAIQVTPNPHYREIYARWARTIRDIANGKYPSTREGMEALKHWMDDKLADVDVDVESVL